ncbi:MAG TPA: hypothetical protein PKC47_07630 [Petrimonas sp.]|nr:hypothetical protein [Petrimonas sp.]
MKQSFDFVFVILVYKNYSDLKEVIPKIKDLSVSNRIVVVEGYSSDEIRENVRVIAESNDCDYIAVENKGYGAGNNRGIEFAFNNYSFKYIVVCNSDIDVVKFDYPFPSEYEKAVIAPVIKTIGGKYQNPYWYKKNKLAEFLMYFGYKHRIKLLLYSGIAIFKFARNHFISQFISSECNEKYVAGAHGSFVIYSKHALDCIGLPYDENMFLFAEESLLSHILDKHDIKVIMSKRIEILHHEDGSMNVSNVHQLEERRKSVVYYYEKLKQMKD